MRIKFPCRLLAALAVVFAGSSCTTSKKLKYFQNIPEMKAPVEIQVGDYSDPVIQPDDILSINVNTVDPEAVEAINSKSRSNPYQGSTTDVKGYRVDKQGFIELPVLGSVKLAGLTTFEAKQALYDKAAEFYKDPVVDVRFSNFRVTILGEVNRPASYLIPNEKVSVLDALGYAGDMTVYGKRNNVLLIRENQEGKDMAVRMDLTDKSMLNSPYFYLKQNDILYVEPSRNRLLNADNTLPRYLGLAATLVSTYVLLIRFTSLGN